MLEPSDVDRMPDQDSKDLQHREGGAGAIGIGLEDTRNNALARQPGYRPMSMLDPKCLDPRGIASLGRPSQADVRGAANI
jgi:hypothetical protein